MSTSSIFDSLPGETIVHILLFLSPNEIRKCQQICRLFRSHIKSSAHLQYLLELDYLGYSVPLRSRSDLGYDEKIRLLREGADSSEQWLSIPYAKDLDNSTRPFTNCQFARGVFARGGPIMDITRDIRVFQLPSLNNNMAYETWHLSDLGVDAQEFKIDLDLDLLVLLEVDTSPMDPDTDLVRRFHVRSLRTGLAHPLAEIPVIVSTDKFSSVSASSSFQIVGKYIALLCSTHSLLSPDPPRISVWDWTTGNLVTRADVPGRSFAFVSDRCFVVQCDRRKWTKEIIGSLEVYTFDPSELGRRARHVASLHLPTTPDTPCHSAMTFTFAPLSPLSFVPEELISPTFPRRIYELSPFSYHISIRIRAYNIESDPTEMAYGTLLIGATSILNAVTTISEREPPVHVPWEKWGPNTFWVNNSGGYSGVDQVVGQRAAFMQYNHVLDAWQIVVYDLGPNAREGVEASAVQPLDPVGAGLYIERIFAGGHGARSPKVASVVAIPTQVIPGNRGFEDAPSFMMDDEHVLLHQIGLQATRNTLHVYTF
ncbi:hypothetical protein FRC12_016301 [Ceratobasidium sp. 428]|nr:hypothetical protein FRC12_016301 [Ceratobasidium sp. 428]